MKKVAIVTMILSFGLLAITGFRAGSLALGSAAAAAGALWLTILLSDTDRKHLSPLLGLTTAIASLDILYGASIYLAGGVIVLSILAWEFAFTEQAVSAFPSGMTRSFVAGHVAQMLGFAIVGFTLFVVPLQVHVGLGYKTALGLGLGSFLLFSVLLSPMRKRAKKEENQPFVKENGIFLLRDGVKKMKKKTGDRKDRPS